LSAKSRPVASYRATGSDLDGIQALEQRVKELSVLLEVSSQVAGQVELPRVLEALLRSLAAALDLRVCFVCLVTPGSEQATIAASWVRERSPQLKVADVTIQTRDHPLVQLGIRDATPLVIRSPADPRLTDADRKQMVGAGCSSALVVPAVVGSEVVALLSLSWGTDHDISVEEERLAQALAGNVGMAVQRARLYQGEMERQAWMGLVLDSVPAGVYSLDSELRIRWVNRAAREMVGIGPTVPEGAHCYDYVQMVDEKGESICKSRCPSLECLRQRQTIRTEGCYLARPGGQRLPVSKIDTYVSLPSGEDRVVGVITDVSHRAASEELRDSLVSIVSHEFRTPLHHIKGFATSLLRTDVDWDTETRQEFLTGIDREADRLTILVSNLLDLSRLEAGHNIFSQRDHCDPVDLAKTVVERAAPYTAGHPVTTKLPASAASLWVDRDQLERVLVNLLENAAKFSKADQPIVLEVRNRRDGVEFHVRDKGRGIPKEDQARLFERFSRAHSVAGVRGAGLGLAICKAFVELHGGKIWLERSTPNRGSDFAFWVPTGPSQPPAEG